MSLAFINRGKGLRKGGRGGKKRRGFANVEGPESEVGIHTFLNTQRGERERRTPPERKGDEKVR